MGLYTKIIDLQKLRLAWKQVYKNKPKEGVDEISCEEFDANRENHLKLLAAELREHTYECQPVRLVPIYKGEKVRYISLFAMRDKVVQCSTAELLSQIYEPCFSKCSYAYRSGKSALHATQDICTYIKGTGDGVVLQTDIHAFFDCILHGKLFTELRRQIREEDVLELIKQTICTPSLERDGSLVEKRRGLYQGSSISPVLSNVYLMRMDRKIAEETRFYVRYSDDLLLFFPCREDAENYQKRLGAYLEELGLEMNPEKTRIVRLEEGFEFLGYHFDRSGITVPDKAKDQLNEKLEEIWLDPAFPSFETRIQKALEIVNGWEQYFSAQEEFGGILEYVVWAYRKQRSGGFDLAKMKRLRGGLKNPYKDVAAYLASVWQECGRQTEALNEYELYFELPELWTVEADERTLPLIKELLGLYERYIVREASDIRTELVQLYTDLKMYRNASALTDSGGRDIGADMSEQLVQLPASGGGAEAVALGPDEIARYMELFVGREDVYALNGLAENRRRICEEAPAPLLPEVVREHLAGEKTVSTYIQRNNSTVKYLVIDLDISRGVLLRQKEGVTEEYLKKCFDVAEKFRKELRHMGMNSLLERSGCRGYHIWVFFNEWIPVRYVNMLTDLLDRKAGSGWKDDDIQVEYFPNKTKLRNGKKGQCMKLPWGIHPQTGQRSCFVRPDGSLYQPQTMVMDDVVRYSLHAVKKMVAAGQADEGNDGKNLAVSAEGKQSWEHRCEADRDLTEFEIVSDAVRTLLEECNLMRYLCQKARKTHYLTHFERLSILYVFGHLGEEGQEFVHKVMAFTLNYSEQVTQKFILRRPEKPVSCIKLREQYKQISAEIGCTCSFRRTKNCYPSPVLHVLKKSEEIGSVTMPLSRVMPMDKQNVLKNEINVISLVQEKAERLVELRKQQRSLEKAARKCEQELAALFDDNRTDSMEIKMGLLVRSKAGERYEWKIEL